MDSAMEVTARSTGRGGVQRKWPEEESVDRRLRPGYGAPARQLDFRLTSNPEYEGTSFSKLPST